MTTSQTRGALRRDLPPRGIAGSASILQPDDEASPRETRDPRGATAVRRDQVHVKPLVSPFVEYRLMGLAELAGGVALGVIALGVERPDRYPRSRYRLFTAVCSGTPGSWRWSATTHTTSIATAAGAACNLS